MTHVVSCNELQRQAMAHLTTKVNAFLQQHQISLTVHECEIQWTHGNDRMVAQMLKGAGYETCIRDDVLYVKAKPFENEARSPYD